jgi:methionyl-tRNA formyltransferase
MVVAAYGLILPASVLQIPRLGCINIHASLLPRWRGAAPIHRAIEAGDTQTGITLMQMDEGLDTGAMIAMASEAIIPDDTTASLHDRLAALGGRMMVDALTRLAQGADLSLTPQPKVSAMPPKYRNRKLYSISDSLPWYLSGASARFILFPVPSRTLAMWRSK